MLQIKYPVRAGQIQEWKGPYSIYNIWDYAFNEKLRVNPSEHKIMLTEAPGNKLTNKRRMLEAMFEKYGFRGAKVSMQALCSLAAQGGLTGCVLDAGDGVSHSVPVFEGVILNRSIRRLDVAGRNVTERLIKLLQARGFNFHRSADMDTVQTIKEKFCYVGYDLKVEQKLALDTTCLVKKYELPDGRTITIGAERYLAPEVMFQPSLGDEMYAEQKGVHEMVYDMIQSTATDLRRSFFGCIVLSGGSTMYPGFPTRLEKELKQLVLNRTLGGDKKRLKEYKINILNPPRRKHMVFMGAATLAKFTRNEEAHWILKDEWEEKGAERCIKEKNPSFEM